MAFVHLFDYHGLDRFEFSFLPKQNMCELSMNPYNGKVFLNVAKQGGSTFFALEVMRELVRACDKLERGGSDDPLRDLLSLVDGSNWDSLFEAEAELLAFKMRKEDCAASGGEDMEKAS